MKLVLECIISLIISLVIMSFIPGTHSDFSFTIVGISGFLFPIAYTVN